MAVISRRSSARRLRAYTAACVVAGAVGVWAVPADAAVPSTTTLSVAPDRPVAGQEATLTAVVSGTDPGGATPTGTVRFNDYDATQVALAADASASLAVFAAAGSYSARADYSGDANFAPSSGSAPLTVARADTAVTVTSSANPATSDSQFEVTATVAVVPPGDAPLDGRLQVSADGVPLGPPAQLGGANGNGVRVSAVLTGPLTATLSFAYSGGANTNPSSASLVQVVNPPYTTPPPPPPPPAAAAITPGALKQMTASLLRSLRRRGPAALRGAGETLTTPIAGRLEQQVYTPDVPTARGGGKRIRLASGRKAFAAAGRGTLKLSLTAAGRRKLRAATRLRLAIATRFTPVTGRIVTVVERLTARRPRGRAARARGVAAGWHVARVRARRAPFAAGPLLPLAP